MISLEKLKPHQIIFNNLLIPQNDGSVSIAETDNETFILHSGAENILWGCVMFKGAKPLLPVMNPVEIRYGMDFWPWSIAWMVFLRKIHPLTGKNYPSGKAIDVGLIMAAGGHDRLMDFVNIYIDAPTDHASLGWIYRDDVHAYLEKFKTRLQEMEKSITRQPSE